MHINIGGGSSDQLTGGQTDKEQIATLTLAWMIDRCRPFIDFHTGALSKLYRDHAYLTRDPTFSLLDQEDPLQVKRNAPVTWAQATKRYVSSFFGYDAQAEHEPPIGYAAGPIVDSYTWTYVLMRTGSKTRTPGGYSSQFRSSTGEAVTSTPDSERLDTKERIHPSVYARMKAVPAKGEKPYMPEALAGFKREPVISKGVQMGHAWVHPKTGVRILEHAIPCPQVKNACGEVDFMCLERQLIKGLLPEFIAELDEANGVRDPYPYVPEQPFERYVEELR
jgi:hypothetical protein